jgi:hypothetical protein
MTTEGAACCPVDTHGQAESSCAPTALQRSRSLCATVIWNLIQPRAAHLAS